MTKVVLTGVNVETIPAGEANGVATLNGSGQLVAAQIPSSVVNGSPNVFYVSKVGNDTASGERWGAAFLTGKRAVEALEATTAKTGTIVFGYGTWEETIKRLPGGNIYGMGGGSWDTFPGTVLKVPALSEAEVLANPAAANGIYDSHWGSNTLIGTGGEIDHIAIEGNRANNIWAAPSTKLIEAPEACTKTEGKEWKVISTAGFPSSGHAYFGYFLCSYESIDATHFKGVKLVATTTGSSYKANVETQVTPYIGYGHGIALQSRSAILGHDIFIRGCVGSGVAIQGAGENGEASFELCCLVHRIEECLRYGIEVLPNASDGMVGFNITSECGLGAYCVASGEYEWINCHPVGGNALNAPSGEYNSPALVRICNRLQNFKNLHVDSATYDGIVLDSLSFASATLDDIQIDCSSQHASYAGTAAGSLLTCYGNSNSSAERVRITGSTPGQWNYIASPYPQTYLVGAQNLESPTKVQILSASSLAPTSASPLSSPLECEGHTINYTGIKRAVGSVSKEVKTTEKEIEITGSEAEIKAAFEASGILVVAYQGTSATAHAALRLKYSSIVGKKLVLEADVPETINKGTGVSQHFVTGVTTSGFSGTTADNALVIQKGREIKTFTGEVDVLLGAGTVAAESGLYGGVVVPGYGMRVTSEASYRIIMQGRALVTAAEITAAFHDGINEVGLDAAEGTNGGMNVFYINPADYPQGSTLRVAMSVVTNAVAPGVSLAGQLYSVEPLGSAEGKVGVKEKAQVGGNAEVTTPAAEALTEGASTPIAMPKEAGFYMLRFFANGAFTAKAAIAVRIRLEAKV
jgi:hypothetical protein